MARTSIVSWILALLVSAPLLAQIPKPGDVNRKKVATEYASIDDDWQLLKKIKLSDNHAYIGVDPEVWSRYDETLQETKLNILSSHKAMLERMCRYLFRNPIVLTDAVANIKSGFKGFSLMPGERHTPVGGSPRWYTFFDLLGGIEVGEEGAEAVTPLEFFSRPKPPKRISAASAMLLLLTVERYARQVGEPAKGDISRVLVAVHPLETGDWWAGFMGLMNLADHQWLKRAYSGNRGLLVPEFKKSLPKMYEMLKKNPKPLTEYEAEGRGLKTTDAQPPSPPVPEAEHALLARIYYEKAKALGKPTKEAKAHLAQAKRLASEKIAEIRDFRL